MSGVLQLKVRMASMPFVPFKFQYTVPQEAVHYLHTHGKLVLRQVAISSMPISNIMLHCRRRNLLRQPPVSLLFSKKSVLTVCACTTSHLQDVVIVGGGIAGLATALALHRLGVKSVLLEQSKQLRTAGSAIGMWTNAWKALDALGVADNLRDEFVSVSGLELLGEDGSLIRSLAFNESTRDIELRAVDRKVLLETLQAPLPDGTVLYDSQVVSIKKLQGGYTEVQCKNGHTIQTKVLIGCDGIGSVVGKYMNVGEPEYAGYTAIRGLAVYPDRHNLGLKARQILGRGVRAGMVPLNSNRVYWFVVFNSPEDRLSDVELVREEALNYVKGWTSLIVEAISNSSLDTFSRRGISDRWMWPGGRPLYSGGVTLAGDAMHLMTPNLGQGGCCALEDAVILARMLSKALSTSDNSPSNTSLNDGAQEMSRIELALKAYTEERWPRVFRLTIQSYFTGAVFQLDSELICLARNKVLSKLANLEGFLSHTLYDCGSL